MPAATWDQRAEDLEMTMDDPVMVSIPMDMMRDIRDALRTCAEDLAIEVDARYPALERKKYPTYQRRWNNDMETVRQAQVLADGIDTQPWASGVWWEK